MKKGGPAIETMTAHTDSNGWPECFATTLWSKSNPSLQEPFLAILCSSDIFSVETLKNEPKKMRMISTFEIWIAQKF